MTASLPASPDAPTVPESPPRPPRRRASTAVIVLAVLAVGYTMWAAQEVLLPILLAMFFALIGNPIIRALRRAYIPTVLGALLLVVGGLAAAGALGYQLIEPAAEWVRQAPRAMGEIVPKLRELTKPVDDASDAAENIARVASGEDKGPPVQVVRTQVDDPYAALTATPMMIASVLAVGQQKRLTVEIMHSIEVEISRYVLTITVINVVVGMVFAGILFLLKVPLQEALLWGTMAALLNFAPYVGPLIGILMMLVMGFVAFDELWMSLLPAGIYLVLHTLEGQILTPVILGRRMRISPLILILALMLFGWMWGIVGLLLAVPLLVCMKIVLSRIEGLEGWATLME